MIKKNHKLFVCVNEALVISLLCAASPERSNLKHAVAQFKNFCLWYMTKKCISVFNILKQRTVFETSTAQLWQ